MTRLIATTRQTLREAARRLRESTIIAVDTETTGLDPHTDVIHSVQFSTVDGKFSVLVPRQQAPSGESELQPMLGPLMELLNDPKHLKVAHNAAFDLKMLIAHYPDFTPVRWFDTMVAERLLTAGTYARSSLADVTERYLGIKRDKEIRTTFYDGTWDGFTWTGDLVDYALVDVETLGAIAKIQMGKVQEQDLLWTARLEMDLLPVWAKMELRGIGYDPEGGREFADDMAREAQRLELELQAALEPFWQGVWAPQYAKDIAAWKAWETEWLHIKQETGKRKGLTQAQIDEQKLRRAVHLQKKPFTSMPKPSEGINPGSPTQLLPTLRATGLALENTKKETLEELAGANQYIDLLLDWRMYSKMAGTFGEPLLESINPVTKRIHPSFNPIVSTGRCSCYSPNLQQVPARTEAGKRLRKLFVSGPGRKLVVADYSGIELVIIGVMSGDAVLLDAINRDLDLHCFTISRALRVPYEDVLAAKDGTSVSLSLHQARTYFESIASIPQLNKHGWNNAGIIAWVKDLRNFFKTITYGTAYGLSKFGLSRRLHFGLDAAEALIALFFETYPGIKKWLTEQGELALQRGYSLTAMGRKRYFRHPAPVTRARVEQRAVELQAKDAKLRGNAAEAVGFYIVPARKELEKEYNSRINSIKRQGGNAPVQGCSADITKLAQLYIEQACVAAGFPLYDGLLLPVHDELIAETSDERAQELYVIMQTQMQRAAMEILLPHAQVDIVVKPVITQYWTH